MAQNSVPVKRKSAKPVGGATRKSSVNMRIQLHLGETTVQRLGVHCSLVHCDKSAVADEILRGWLVRYGKGREAFPAESLGDEELTPPPL